MTDLVRIKRALVSVSDKTGVVEFCQELKKHQVDILSTGGTAKLLEQNGVPVTEVSDYTGFPEMMDGRLKTLHPKVHGGILGRRGQDTAVMAEHNIQEIDLIVVNLYPFAATIAKEGCTLEQAIENIDIGGPTMLRAAAKNWKDVAVCCKAEFYGKILAEMNSQAGQVSKALRFFLSRSTYEETSKYDGMIASYLGGLGEIGAEEAGSGGDKGGGTNDPKKEEFWGVWRVEIIPGGLFIEQMETERKIQ